MVCLSLNPTRKIKPLMYGGEAEREVETGGEVRSVWISRVCTGKLLHGGLILKRNGKAWDTHGN